jgi:hypothetical protein
MTSAFRTANSPQERVDEGGDVRPRPDNGIHIEQIRPIAGGGPDGFHFLVSLFFPSGMRQTCRAVADDALRFGLAGR